MEQEQQKLVTEIETLIELVQQMEHASGAGEDMSYAVNAVSFMVRMKQLETMLAIPSAGCEDQADLASQEDVQ